MPLNEAQTRALATTLEILEQRCQQMRRLISDPAANGVLHQVVDDIPATGRDRILANLAAIEAVVARLAAEYQLTAQPRSARQILVALLSSSWEHLEDTRRPSCDGMAQSIHRLPRRWTQSWRGYWR